MKHSIVLSILSIALLAGVPAHAQLGGLGRALDKAKQAADTVDALTFSDAEERQMGSEISAKLREKYGVVQDREVHKYVTLVGRVVSAGSSRPNLQWTFVVLDTDGVNAFAAPGGFIHITRGALALIRNEAELADVLAHEIAHVTEKHTLNAVKKSKGVQAAANAARSTVVQAAIEESYAAVLENDFDRNDEMTADRIGVTLANRAGYAPTGLGAFLTRLADRNKALKERSGIFASHPESQARLGALAKVIASSKLTASALVVLRYGQSVAYKPVPVTTVAQTAPPTRAAGPSSSSAGNGPNSSASSGKGFGLSNLTGVGRDRTSDSVSSAGSRGVNPDRDAAGGSVKTLVAVAVTAAEIDAFKKGISG